jgi:hypothetical protein
MFKLYCLWQHGRDDAIFFRSRSHLMELCPFLSPTTQRGGAGDIGMVFVRLSIRLSVCPSVHPSFHARTIRVRSITFQPLEKFHETVLECSPHQDDMQNPCSNLADSRSRSPVVFEELNHVFHVRFISSEPLEGISWNFSEMFSPSRWRAEPMFQPGRLKVKVTSGVWRFEPCISCPVHIFWIPRRNLIKL